MRRFSILVCVAAAAVAGPVVVAGPVSEQVGEACVQALAEREGQTRAEVLASLSTVFDGTLEAGGTACDIAAATASPVAIYLDSLGAWMRQAGTPIQLLLAISAVGAGLLCAWDGPKVWRALFTMAAALAAAGVTHHEASLWGLSPNLVSDFVLMAQAGAAVALAVFVGFEGSQVLFGVLLGLIGAYGFGDWARAFEDQAPGISLLWYELGAVAGFLFYTVWRKAVLATLAPLMGGYLATVGLGVLLGRACSWIADPVPSALPGASEPWISAAIGVLGEGGSRALPVHCACALLASLLHSTWEVRPLSVGVLVSSIIIAAVSAATGFLCQVWSSTLAGLVSSPTDATTDSTCPRWLAKSEDWEWPLFGCLLWAGIAGAAAWRQLALLATWEQDNFWRAELSGLRGGFGGGGAGGAGPYGYEDGDSPHDPLFATRLPAEYLNTMNSSMHSQQPGMPMARPQGEPWEDFKHSLNEWWSSTTGQGQQPQHPQHPQVNGFNPQQRRNGFP